MKNTVKYIEWRIARKEIALEKARTVSTKTFSNLGWGSGMRRVKLVSYTRENNIQYELNELQIKLKQLKEQR